MQRFTWLALVAIVAAVASVGVATAPGASRRHEAAPPAKQIAALKRQVAALKRQVSALKGQVTSLQAENKRLAPFAPSAIAEQLTQTKAALDKYQSVDQAKADGYAQSSPCESTAIDPHQTSYGGVMGIHFVNASVLQSGTLNPAKPPILVYVPTGSGFRLVAAEYFKPDADQNVATDEDRPSLFGRAFDGPMMGHAPGMPIHYDLHVWLWNRNPSGMFAAWNPTLSCG